MDKQQFFEKIKKAVIECNKEEAEALAKKAIEEKLDLNEVIEKGYVPGIQKVGNLWENGEYFLPELITAAECMKAAMNVLQPELATAHIETKSLGKVVIGTVEGDIHDIGKNLVSSMLSANGFEVVDLGADIKLEKFIDKAQEVKAYGQFKVMVGGAPVNRQWAEEIGADGYGESAISAVKEAKKLVESTN